MAMISLTLLYFRFGHGKVRVVSIYSHSAEVSPMIVCKACLSGLVAKDIDSSLVGK